VPVFNITTASYKPMKDSPVWLCRSWT